MGPNKKTSSHCTVPNGCLVIVGGAEQKEGSKNPDDRKPLGAECPVLAAFVENCPKKHPHIELISTASSADIAEGFEAYKATFMKYGARDVGHIHHNSRGEVDEEALRERIRKADAVFMTGGDQLRLTSIYGGTPFLTELKEAYMFNKLTIGGTSAGAMALSTPMIFAGAGEREMVAAGVKVTTGLEFLKDVCIDTHFVHRGRFVRMAQVIATNPASIGIGIEEDTAIIVTKGLNGKVVGSGVVILIDGVRSHSTNILEFNEEKKLTIRDLDVSILADGETFEIPQRNPPHR